MTENNSLPWDFERLEETIGYKFNDKSLLKTALTHSSYANEHKTKDIPAPYNERLEFLGDSVLSFITSEYIFANYRKFPEGDLTKLRAAVVCENALFVYAQKIELGKYLYLGNCEEINGGRQRKSLLSDAFEATLAALYLDGGIEKAKKFVLPYVAEHCTKMISEDLCDDYKSRLQIFIQQNKGDILEYRLSDESGPAHMKKFTIEVLLNNNVIGTGEGSSKRNAEQNAAKEALALFGELDDKK